MKHYIASTIHKVGYEFLIKAPNSLTNKDIADLLVELCEYTDHPEQGDLLRFLNQYDYTGVLDEGKMRLYKKIQIKTECVSYEVTLKNSPKESK